MCKQNALFLGAVFMLHTAVAQESPQTIDDQEAHVIGEISDGSIEAPVPKELPEAHILKTKTIVDQGRTIRICRVDASDSSEPAPPVNLAPEEVGSYLESEEFQTLQAHHEQSELCIVSATVYDRQRTLVRWWPEGAQEACECWSNVDFNFLSGFHEFEGRGQRYMFILALANVSAEQGQQDPENVPTVSTLPEIEEQGPLYMVTEGDTEDTQAMKVMDVLHDLYEAEEVQLKAAYALREQNRQQREAELAANPPQPKDNTIYYRPKKSRWHDVQVEGGAE